MPYGEDADAIATGARPIAHFTLSGNATITHSTEEPFGGKLSSRRHKSRRHRHCETTHPRNREGSPIMSLASHLAELQRKHGDLERKLDDAMASPSTDHIEIAKLKRRKLALKDEIERLKLPTRH